MICVSYRRGPLGWEVGTISPKRKQSRFTPRYNKVKFQTYKFQAPKQKLYFNYSNLENTKQNIYFPLKTFDLLSKTNTFHESM